MALLFLKLAWLFCCNKKNPHQNKFCRKVESERFKAKLCQLVHQEALQKGAVLPPAALT